MNIILLSGGSGKRLWPLSNGVRSKQFIRFFKNEEGKYESMLQQVYRGLKAVDPEAAITIATARSQVSEICNQLGGKVGISDEPCRRDTFPAIALAAAYLKDVKGVREDEPVVICPVDPYVDSDFFDCLREIAEHVLCDSARLTLMGIEVTYPSEKYGYIIPDGDGHVCSVSSFKEKPDLETAKRYMAEGALWNGGVFAARLGYLLEKAHELIAFDDYKDLYGRYETLQRISFDYAVVEKETSIDVVRFAGSWKDIGTWNTLTESMAEKCVGEGRLGDSCDGVHVINELPIPVLAMGLKDVVIAASPDGILVSDKHESSFIKPYVDGFTDRIMYAEKSWGSYRVVNVEDGSLTIKVTLNAGQAMHYHSHMKRDEIWVVIAGSGRTVINEVLRTVGVGDVITMHAGDRHTVIADETMKLIEVQIGQDISVEDKVKHDREACFTSLPL